MLVFATVSNPWLLQQRPTKASFVFTIAIMLQVPQEKQSLATVNQEGANIHVCLKRLHEMLIDFPQQNTAVVNTSSAHQSLAAFRRQLKTVLFRTSFGEDANA